MPDDIASLLRNLIALERIANTVALESEARIQALYAEIVEDLRKIDPTGPVQTTYKRDRTDDFLREVAGRLRTFVGEEEKALKDRLALIGRVQGKRAEVSLQATLGTLADRVRITPITQQRMRAILNTDPFQGRLLKEHMSRLGANAYVRVRDQVRIGMLNEESVPDMVRRIRGSQAGVIRQHPETGAFVRRGTPGAVVRPRFVGGVLSTTTREAEALVRTAVTHVASEGMRETFRANKTILAGVQYNAVLDSRTTEICLSLDGQVWPADSDDIVVPGRDTHWNCRSALTPVVDWEKLGVEAPPEPMRTARDESGLSTEDLNRRVSARRRRGELGTVTRIPSSVRAAQWLRDQPVRVQEKMLGVGKAKLFREGKVSLGDLVRRDGRVVPLDELVGT